MKPSRLFAVLVVACCPSASAQVCQLRSGSDHGTAVCVGSFDADRAAVLLTAGHLCRDGDVVEVAPEGRWIPARVLARDDAGPGRDLALLAAPGYQPRVTYKLGMRTPPADAELLLAGFERAGPLHVRRTRIARHGAGYVELDVPGVGGLSGGPLLHGRVVVGILTHNNVVARRGECTNIETIQAALAQWGLAEGDRSRTQGVLGAQIVVGRCGPGGCRPITPLYPAVPFPAAPYAATPFGSWPTVPPQPPGWPGFPSRPDDNEVPQPPSPTNPAAPPDAAVRRDIDRLRDSLDRLDAAQTEMQLALKALAATARTPGPQGPAGRDGKDGAAPDAAKLNSLVDRLDRLEAARIPVRILDGEGKTIDERTYKLGEPLEFRLVPRPR